jgi:hypothetical protein
LEICAKRPGGGAQHADGGVHIISRADGRIDQRGGRGKDRDGLFAEQKPSHIKVMDHHVAEQPAGALDVFERRRGGVARQHRHQFHIADFAAIEPAFQRREGRIEAPVEADHQRRACLRHVLQQPADAG